MNVFTDLARPLLDRPGTSLQKPAPRNRPTKYGGPHSRARKLRHLGIVETPWGLTPAQAEIMRQVATGLSNQEIADALGLNVKTVEAHLFNAYQRIQAHETSVVNRVRAAVLWVRFMDKALR